jgi:hypothetical protein
MLVLISDSCDKKRVSGAIVLLLLDRRIPKIGDYSHWETQISRNIIYVTTWEGVETELKEAKLATRFPAEKLARFLCTYRSAWQIINSIIDKDSINGIPTTSNMKQGGSRRRFSRLSQLLKIPQLLGRSSGTD